MCHTPMRHLTMALPPSSLHCAKSSPPCSAFPSLSTLFIPSGSPLLFCFFFPFPSSFYDLCSPVCLSASHLQIRLSFRLSIFPSSSQFAALQYLAASPSNPIYLSSPLCCPPAPSSLHPSFFPSLSKLLKA